MSTTTTPLAPPPRAVESSILAGGGDDERMDRARQRNVWLCLLVTFYANLSVSLLLPSIWPYLQLNNITKDLLGWPVSMFALGQLIGSPLLGHLASTLGFKFALLASLALQILSYLVYAQIGSMGLASGTALFLISLTRLVGGLGMGALAVVLAFVAESTTSGQRVTRVASIEMTAALAFASGPGLSFLLALTPEIGGGFFVFSHTTSPAWLGGFLGSILLVVVAALFRNTPRLAVYSQRPALLSARAKGEPIIALEAEEEGGATVGKLARKNGAIGVEIIGESSVGEHASYGLEDDAEEEEEDDDDEDTISAKSAQTLLQTGTGATISTPSMPSTAPIYNQACGGRFEQRSVLLCMLALVSLLQNNGLSVYETVSVPIMEADFQFGVLENSVAWTLIGSSSVLGLLLLKFLGRARLRRQHRRDVLMLGESTEPSGRARALLRFVFPPSEYSYLLFNFAVAGFGFFVIAVLPVPPISLWVLGSFCVGSNYPQASAGMGGIYTKVVGVRRKARQGMLAGVFFGAGAIARLLGPLYSAPLYKAYHSSPVFSITTGCFVVSFLVLVVIKRPLLKLVA